MKPTALVSIALAGLLACNGELTNEPNGDDDTTEEEEEDNEPEPLCTVQARSYPGFGGPLEAGRVEAVAGSDRLRVKPFAALAGEYRRVLGLDAPTRPYRATFGAPPARWYEEPQASANTLFAAYSIAYEACLEYTATGEEFAAAPTAETAEQICAGMASTFWDREATADEASACATFAVSETKPEDGPRVQWAYACAAVLTSSSFLSY